MKLVLVLLLLISNAFASRLEIVTEKYDRVLAISDVHGQYENLLKLLLASKVIDPDNHWVSGKTLIVVVGDSINKGPESLKVLDLWISLTEEAQYQGGRIIHLLGNHEAELLAQPHGMGFDSIMEQELLKRGISYENFINPEYKYGRFLRDMPAFAQVGKWIFFHSGFMPDENFETYVERVSTAIDQGDYLNNLIVGSDSFLEQIDWWLKPEENLRRLAQAGFEGLVFGHKPKAFGVEGQIALRNERLIKIDTGMAPNGGSHNGEILHFENGEIFAVGSEGIKKPLAP